MDFSQMLRGAVPTVGELRYGFVVAGLKLVPGERVLTEMVADARVFPVPRAAPGIAGVINLRGTVVPLLDRRASRRAVHIRPFLHRALVFDRDDHRVGLLLDEPPQLLSLQPACVPVPRQVHGGAALLPFLTRPWARVDQADEIWWEFNHRAAFESLAHAAEPTDTVIEDEVIQ